MQLVLDRFGRVVIPKAMRDDLDLEPGTVLEVHEGKEGLILTPVREDAPVIRKDGLLVFSGELTGDVETAVAEHRLRRLRHSAGTGR